MQRAFVLQLRRQIDVNHGRFEGRVEHVDSGRTLRFRTVQEFLTFVEACVTETSNQNFEGETDEKLYD